MLGFLMLFVRNDDFPFFNTDLACMLRGYDRIIHGRDHITSFDFLFILHQDLPLFWYIELIMDHFTLFDANKTHICVLIRLDDMDRTLDLGYDGFALGLFAGFE